MTARPPFAAEVSAELRQDIARAKSRIERDENIAYDMANDPAYYRHRREIRVNCGCIARLGELDEEGYGKWVFVTECPLHTEEE